MLETSETASSSTLARFKHFFHRSKQGSSTTIANEICGTGTAGRAQDQAELSQAVPGQDTATATSDGGAQKQQKKSLVPPTKDAIKSVAEPEPEHTPVSTGKEVDAAVIELDRLHPISRIGNGAVDFVGSADTAFIKIQDFDDRYLKPFKGFNQIAATTASVHSYAQIVLGILTSVVSCLSIKRI